MLRDAGYRTGMFGKWGLGGPAPRARRTVGASIWEGRAWCRTSALYGPEWNLRDHGRMFQKWVRDRWWTEATLETGGDGTSTLNAFKGEYRVVAEKGNRSGSARLTLTDEGTSVEITID